MNLLHDTDKHIYIVYNIHKSNKKNAPYVIFLHGLMSNMNRIKAQYIFNFCKKIDINCILFNNFGHENASGQFQDQTIGQWLYGLELVMNKLIDNSKVILVGSSMGGWISLLAALKHSTKISALITLCAAVDFTEEIIWNKLPLIKQEEMKSKGLLMIKGDEACAGFYPISYKLIKEGRDHLLLNKDVISIKCPTHLIHGLQDKDIPYAISNKILEKIESKEVVLKIIKDGDHKLSRTSDLHIISNSISELLLII